MKNPQKNSSNSDLIESYNSTRLESHRHTLCHAPFLNMNFDQAGKVRACCFNVIHELGHYPQDTISNIWLSARAQGLRRAIQNSDLSQGCYNCEQQILSQSFHSVHARTFDRLIQKPSIQEEPVPLSFEFELSNVCNLECEMCNGFFSSLIRKNREKLPALPIIYNEEFVRQMKPFWAQAKSAKFLGGEPFLNPLYYKMWDDIFETNSRLHVSIHTNGTLLNDKIISVLEKLKPSISISLDSIDKNNYEKIRKNANFEKTMENLKFFQEHSRKVGRSLSISICPMTTNWEEIPNIFDWANCEKIYVYVNTLTQPAELSLKNLSPDRIDQIVQIFKKRSRFLQLDMTEDIKDFNPGVNFNKFMSLVAQLESWAKPQD